MAKLLQSQLYQVAPRDPAVFVSVAVLLALTAFSATGLAARSATRVDPVDALRNE